jgi:glycosyltransferase involved in cell wall biosynthesis
VIIAHNVESLIWERMYQTERNPAKRWYVGHQWRKYEAYEARTLQRAGRVVAVTNEDAALLQSRFGVKNPGVVDNGVDLAHYTRVSDRTAVDPKQILFLGSLDWRPNLDALDLLLTRILPAVVAQEPSARLSVVGRNPPEHLIKAAQTNPNLELHADVPDVAPYLNRSGVMAVPLRIGGGSRLKILESLAAGLPVVSTTIGCEGLAFRAGKDLVVVDDVDDMAAALVHSIREPSAAAAMARNARELIEQRYDWSILARKLEGIWAETAAKAG